MPALPRWDGAVLVAVLAAIYLPWTWSDQLGSLGGDSAVYLLSARTYAAYLPPDDVARAVAVESQFPPLYPALLAATGGAEDLRIAHVATTACLLAAFAAFYAALTAVGLSRPLAIAGVAVFAALPGSALQSLELLSESLYLALSLGGLACLLRASPGGASRQYWVATTMLAAALMTRSAGVALIPALAIVLWRNRPRGWPWMPVLVVLPALAWALQRRGEHGYSNDVLGYLGMPWTQVVEQLAANAGAFAWGIGANIVQTAALPWVTWILALPCAAMLLLRLARFEPDAWYVLAYVAMLILWPYPAEARRLAWVILPWLLCYVLLAGWMIAARPWPGRPAFHAALRWLAPAILALVALPTVLWLLERRFDPEVAKSPALARLPEWYEPDASVARTQAGLHLGMAAAIRELGQQVPAEECIHSIKPALVAFLARRDGFIPPFPDLDDASFRQWLAHPRCRYVLLLAATDGLAFNAPYYPGDRLGQNWQLVDLRRAADGSVLAALGRLLPPVAARLPAPRAG